MTLSRKWVWGALALLALAAAVALTVNWSTFPLFATGQHIERGAGQVAFLKMTGGDDSPGGDVYLFDVPSGVVRQLTLGGRVDRIAWSLDGSLLYLHVSRTDGQPTAYSQALQVSTGILTSLGAGPAIDPDLHPAVSPDGTQVVYASKPGNDDTSAIIAARPDGLSPKTIGAGSGPQWSPDGKRIVFSNKRAGDADTEIYTMTPDGGDIRKVAAHPGDDVLPAWSRDGRTIAFATYKMGINHSAFVGFEYSRVDVDGGNLATIEQSVVTSPVTFLAGGDRVLTQEFQSICAISTAGGRNSCAAADSADLSPDGLTVAFAQDVNHDGSMLCLAQMTGRADFTNERCDQYSSPTRLRWVLWRPG